MQPALSFALNTGSLESYIGGIRLSSSVVHYSDIKTHQSMSNTMVGYSASFSNNRSVGVLLTIAILKWNKLFLVGACNILHPSLSSPPWTISK